VKKEFQKKARGAHFRAHALRFKGEIHIFDNQKNPNTEIFIAIFLRHLIFNSCQLSKK